jgi:hypothetical protein
MKKLFSLLVLTSLALAAGELTGKWSGNFDITNSEGDTKSDVAYITLKLEGTTVTGTAGPDENQQWAIKNGKLTDGKLTFHVDLEDGGAIDFDLVFDGDKIKGSAQGTGHEGEKMSAKVALKRVS